MGSAPAHSPGQAQGRSARVRTALAALCALLATLAFIGFFALGTWQIERRAWKIALIERVTSRVQAAPVDIAAVLDDADRTRDEYRRVRLQGVFLNDRETLVQAATELGGGFWVLTPLQRANGSHVLVNRGFVTPERRDPATRGEAVVPTGAASPVTVVGLLRLSEPDGGFLRRNDAAANRWHSRDVQAIAAARGLANVAPYFVDAEDPEPKRPDLLLPDAVRTWPVAGLTVIRFYNNHLVYALTWYGLALMVALAAGYVLRERMREKVLPPTISAD